MMSQRKEKKADDVFCGMNLIVLSNVLIFIQNIVFVLAVDDCRERWIPHFYRVLVQLWTKTNDRIFSF